MLHCWKHPSGTLFIAHCSIQTTLHIREVEHSSYELASVMEDANFNNSRISTNIYSLGLIIDGIDHQIIDGCLVDYIIGPLDHETHIPDRFLIANFSSFETIVFCADTSRYAPIQSYVMYWGNPEFG